MAENSNVPGRKADRSIFFPLLIIFVGIILLLSNLNFLPGNGWDILIRFWPIFFVFGGVDDLLNLKWPGAIINVGVGTILILANFGYFSLSTWQIITNFWPILIIGIGLNIIFRGRSMIGSIAGIGLAILLVLGLLWFVYQAPSTKESVSHPISYEVGDVKQAELNIKPLVGYLTLGKADSTELLINGEIITSNNENLRIESEIIGQSQKISLSTTGEVVLPSNQMNNKSSWDIFLNPNMTFDINIDQIFGNQTLTLTGLDIKDLQSKLVIGSMYISLPEIENLNVNLECVIGEMIIVIPEGIPVTIDLDSGITGVSVGDGFIREGDKIYSKTSDKNGGYVLKVDLPIGSLKVMNP